MLGAVEQDLAQPLLGVDIRCWSEVADRETDAAFVALVLGNTRSHPDDSWFWFEGQGLVGLNLPTVVGDIDAESTVCVCNTTYGLSGCRGGRCARSRILLRVLVEDARVPQATADQSEQQYGNSGDQSGFRPVGARSRWRWLWLVALSKWLSLGWVSLLGLLWVPLLWVALGRVSRCWLRVPLRRVALGRGLALGWVWSLPRFPGHLF